MPAHIIQYIALADDDVDDREIFTEICEDINVPFRYFYTGMVANYWII